MAMIHPGFLSLTERLALEACARKRSEESAIARAKNALLLSLLRVAPAGKQATITAMYQCLPGEPGADAIPEFFRGSIPSEWTPIRIQIRQRPRHET